MISSSNENISFRRIKILPNADLSTSDPATKSLASSDGKYGVGTLICDKYQSLNCWAWTFSPLRAYTENLGIMALFVE